MQVESHQNTPSETTESHERPIKRVLRPLNPQDTVKTGLVDEPEEGSSKVVFRLKRKPEVEPWDILAIDGMDIPTMSKKHQAKHIRDLEEDLNKLNIDSKKEEENKTENKTENKKEEEKKFLEGLVFFENSVSDVKFVLKRIDPGNIFDLEKDEAEFRKNYKTIYIDMNTKAKRDAKLQELRKNRLENLGEEEKGEDKKKKYKVFDIRVAEEFKQNMLYCNEKPMIVTNLLEMAMKKQKEAEGNDMMDEGQYEYYALKKVSRKEASGAQQVMLHPSAKGVINSHLAEEDEEFVNEKAGKESDQEMDVDQRDSNAEDNSENDYPDEEEENVKEKSEEDFWYNSEEEEENQDEDDEYADDNYKKYGDKGFHETNFKANFWSKIKDMSQETFD